MNLKEYIRVILDFPEPGVRFKDITPLLQRGEAFRFAIDQLTAFAKEKRAEVIVGPEARGFVIGAPIAYALSAAFVPVRKAGKLPFGALSAGYQLEYGKESIEIHQDAIVPGQRVVVADDLLATGGTIRSTIQLVEKLGGIVVGAAFLIELSYLHGRDQLVNYDICSLIEY